MEGPRRVRNFLPSTNTGAAGASPVPGREMPILACLDSPGPLTMQPMTATLSVSTPGYCVFQPGISSRMKSWIERASSWNVVAACPGCGRTTSTTFQELARSIQDFIRDEMPAWKTQYPGVETLNVAVMGCIVNGPGESKHANIGISLPGTGEAPAAPVFVDGKKFRTLRGPTIAADFKALVIDYIDQRYGSGAKAPAAE